MKGGKAHLNLKRKTLIEWKGTERCGKRPGY